MGKINKSKNTQRAHISAKTRNNEQMGISGFLWYPDSDPNLMGSKVDQHAFSYKICLQPINHLPFLQNKHITPCSNLTGLCNSGSTVLTIGLPKSGQCCICQSKTYWANGGCKRWKSRCWNADLTGNYHQIILQITQII